MGTSIAVGRMNVCGHLAAAVLAASLIGCSASEKPKVEKGEDSQSKAMPTRHEKTGQLPEGKTKAATERKTREDKAPTPPTPKQARDASDSTGGAAEKPKDLGSPLVDDPGALRRLHPQQLIWIDPKHKHVVMVGEACRAGYPLEFFATYANRSYESVLAVNVRPQIAHAALVLLGAEPGHPAKFQPKFIPPTGTEVAVEVRWKDGKGAVQSAPAQHWIRDIQTKKSLSPKMNWVFAGSMFVKDEETGREYYQADSGELICVLSLPNAMLDLPIHSYGPIEERRFEAFEEHLPPPGTPVTILLKPVLSDQAGGDARPVEKNEDISDAQRIEYEAKAAEAARLWFELADRGEYSKCWDAASSRFKSAVERRDFIKRVGGVRRPLGQPQLRTIESKQYTSQIPGAPRGQYIVLQYQTSFDKKGPRTEIVSVMLDKDKKWRISGYSVK